MPCSLSATQAAACLSGIGKEVNSTKLLQIIAQLVCEAAEAGGGGGRGNFGAATLIVDNLPLNQAVILDQAHGLGGLPFLIKVHLKCVSADAGYAVGDEIDIAGMVEADPGIGDSFFTYGCNITNIYIISQNPNGVLNWALPSVNSKNGVGTSTITVASWVAKFYAWR